MSVLHLLKKSVIAAAVCSVVFTACKKKDNTPAGPVYTVDNLIGNFEGRHFFKYKNTAPQGIFSDSSVRKDTFIITKVMPDSFTLTKPYWDVTTPAFIYSATNSYSRSIGTTAFNDRLREISIRYNSTLDSIYVDIHYVMVSSNILEQWDSFAGKRQ